VWEEIEGAGVGFAGGQESARDYLMGSLPTLPGLPGIEEHLIALCGMSNSTWENTSPILQYTHRSQSDRGPRL